MHKGPIAPAKKTPTPFVLWMTGLSGAGKSTLARALCEELTAAGCAVELLDGDAIRTVFTTTGYTKEERDEHIKRVGFTASLLEKHGVIVICSLVSPYREARNFVRNLCRNFVEVFVDTPLSVCEERDPKGLYRKVRAGEIRQFTGIDDPYEPPEHPEVHLRTAGRTAAETLGELRQALARYLSR